MRKIKAKYLENSFLNKVEQKNLKKLKFLKKYLNSKSNIYVDKITGIVRADLKLKSKETLGIWNNIFDKKILYTAERPSAKVRLFYVLQSLYNFLHKKKFSKIKLCDFATGEGEFLNLIKLLKKNHVFMATEGSKTLSDKIRKKKIDCLNILLGDYDKTKKFKIKPNIATVCWTLCNCIDPLSVLKDIHSRLDKNSYMCVAESSRILVPFKKTISDYFNPKSLTDSHPFHFSKQSLENLITLAGFKVCYINRYFDSDVLMIIAKKTLNTKKNFKVDNYKDVEKFFLQWHNFSKYLSKLQN